MKLSNKRKFFIITLVCAIGGAAITIVEALTRYKARSKVSECVARASTLKMEFINFVMENEKFPESMAELKLPEDFSKAQFEDISIIPSGFMVTCNVDNQETTISLVLRPEGDKYNWSCIVGEGGEKPNGYCSE